MKFSLPFRIFPLVSALTIPLSSCDHALDTELPKSPRILATESLSRQIEEFVGGHAKVVWAKHTSSSNPDTFANYEGLELWGIDTRDDKGARPILKDASNYGRPLISPSGSAIVFTHKGMFQKSGSKKRDFKPIVFRVDWDGKHLEKLAEGYAVDVWRDPQTSVEWVYVAELEPTERASMNASKLERFKLLDPGERELVWDKSKISTENIQLSRDGTRASALFPWPDTGIMHIDEKRHEKIKVGCWPSLAPDNSYLFWVFDGAHKNLRFYNTEKEENWTIPINKAPSLGGHEVYHPRWSNHTRLFSMTGPYSGKSIGQSNMDEVEIVLGRFNEEMRKVEAWLTITNDKQGDVFPDLWVRHVDGEGGRMERKAASATSASSEKPSKKIAAEKDPEPKKLTPHGAPVREWPFTGLPLLFVWEDRNVENLAGLGVGRPCSVAARENARFGPWFDLRADGGRFEVDSESAKAVHRHFAKLGNPFTLEILATPFAENQDGIVIGNEQFQLKQRGTEWVFVETTPRPTRLWIGNARVGEPNHLSVAFDGAEFIVMHNGKTVNQGRKDVSDVEMLAGRRGLNIGSGWEGAVEAISIAPGRLDESRIEASWEYLQEKIGDRKPIPRIRLRGKLTEMTADRPVEALDTYQRGLLGYLYEVEEVLEGSYDADKVLVMHWTILDRKPLQSFPRKLGESYELFLEPFNAHSQLVSERQWNDILEPIEPYYDVETPKP